MKNILLVIACFSFFACNSPKNEMRPSVWSANKVIMDGDNLIVINNDKQINLEQKQIQEFSFSIDSTQSNSMYINKIIFTPSPMQAKQYMLKGKTTIILHEGTKLDLKNVFSSKTPIPKAQK